ncbi:hypothetical protein HY285_05005 [Candidatus Peregrinibacteria bacterium]|nr:hypothetical protein [Candidatus Peregrinibacteria bacterium]MBI3816870.1 hypothetical protein [Candidatus Peregrinibacteria bacterium]
MRRLLKQKLKLFAKDPYNKQLDNHALDHAWKQFRSIDITPNWIAVYREYPGKEYVFMTCGDKTRVLKPWRVLDKPIPDWITLYDKEYWS